MKNIIKFTLGAALLSSTAYSQAALIGIFGDQTAAASNVATSEGHTAAVITDFSDLSSYDVVWGLNGSNGSHLSQLTSFSASFDSYISSGGVFMYHDRYVTNANTVLAGAGNFNMVRDFTHSTNIDLSGPSAVAGMNINNSTLDNGNSSSHGYTDMASIDLPYTAIFNNSIAAQLVDFVYEYGAGHVYYSTIPMDHYLGGANLAAFTDIYAPNVLNFAASLSQPIPEPITVSMLLLGLGGIFATRKNKRAL